MASLQIVASLWIHPDQQNAFEAYELKVAQIMRRHGGVLLQTVRTSDGASPSTEVPFEVHLLEFPSRAAFEAYRSDPELVALSPERAVVISRTEVVLGTAGPKY
ncbi:MAG: DUF1330 domain-containing protein [Pseudomonadota bacterium]